MNLDAAAQQAQASGQQRQQQLDTQSQQLQGQYGQATNQANQAQQNLSQFTGNMQNFGDVYGKDLTSAQQMYGFDPTQLLKANQALANTNTTMANLPQAVQQQGNYYGTTAGSEAANYANMAGNLNAVQQGQANTANAFKDVLAATQQQAAQQSTQELAGQQQKLQGLQAAAQNATAIMDTSRQTMTQIEALAQQQGYLTAQQVAQYQNAKANLMSAAAAQTQASASMIAAQSQAQLNQQQYEMIQAFRNSPAYKQYTSGGGLNMASLQQAGAVPKNPSTGGAAGYNFSIGGKPVSANTFAQQMGINLPDLLTTMGNTGDRYAAQAAQALNATGGKATPQVMQNFAALFANPTATGGGGATSATPASRTLNLQGAVPSLAF